jgi:multiple sugar transport system substrate-binding protein
MWAWGGREVGTDGKVAINSKETVESVKFFTGFWKDACDEGGLAWDDSNNNRAFLSGTIAATINGASIYIESLRNKEKYKTDTGALMHTDIQHAATPAGPAGAYAIHTAFNHGIMSYSKNQKLAKDFLKWWYAKPQMEAWFTAQKGFAQGLTKVWESHPMWQQDPVMLPYRDAASKLRLFGHAGPANAKASEAYSKYIVIDMYAKALQGMPAEESVKWAEGELKKVYG